MVEWVEFPRFITKGIEVEKGDRRIFKGHITAEIIDRQQEFIFVAEVMKIMKAFMEVNPVISDFHSNRKSLRRSVRPAAVLREAGSGELEEEPELRVASCCARCL